MKKTRRICAFILFIVIMFIINHVIVYVTNNDYNSYTRLMMYEMYHQKENIDILFLGSSHCYRSIDTEIMDENFKANTFNAGTSSQALDGTYYLLKEVEKTNNLKTVYVELYYGIMGNEFKERTDLTQTYIISDYLKPSIDKVNYLLQASNGEHYINSFIPSRRKAFELFNFYDVLYCIREKNKKEYKNYKYLDSGNEYYAGKGFVYSNEMIEDESELYEEIVPIKEDTFSKDDKYYLNKIIQYCNKKDIQLIFFSAPMTRYRLDNVGNYDSYVMQVNNFLKSYNIQYYDFNLCKDTYLNLTLKDFKDNHHLNGYGAKKFSKVFAEFFTNRIEKNIFN